MRAPAADGARIKLRIAVCLAALVLAAGCGSAPTGGGTGAPPSQPAPGQQPGQGGSATTPSVQGGGASGQQGGGAGQGSGSGGGSGSVRKQVRPAPGGFEVSVGGPILGLPGFFFAEPVRFGQERLGTESAAKVFRVKLATRYPARIDQLSLADAGVDQGADDFAVSDAGCAGQTLQPQGQSCTASVRFRPQAAGEHSAYLVISVTILCTDRDRFPCAPPDPNLPPGNYPEMVVSPSGQVTVRHGEPLALLRGEGVDTTLQGTTGASESTTPTGSSEEAGASGSNEPPPPSEPAPASTAPTANS
jgi:hypothetical protein